ncbi:MAG TPA: hypothetical protein VH253_03910 [Phycisphaerae bacterium]|nr:hypothetical protein [Phycisphaerae bacterium]
MRSLKPLLLILWPLILAAAPPATAPFPLVISKQTTWIEAPLLPDGTIDYPAYLREVPAVPASADAAPLLQESLAAWQPFQDHALDPATHIRITNALDGLAATLWSSAEHPDVADWLHQNDAAFALLDQASRLPALALVLDDATSARIETLARALLTRAGQRAAAGDHDAARADAATLFRFARLLQPLRHHEASALAGIIDNDVFRLALVDCRSASPPERQHWLDLLRSTSDVPLAIGAFDADRCATLDSIMPAFRGNPVAALQPLISVPSPRPAITAALRQTDLASVDWNVVLRLVNRQHDHFIDLLRKPSLDRLDELRDFSRDIGDLPAPFGPADSLRRDAAVGLPAPVNPAPAPDPLATLHNFLRREPHESTPAFSTRVAAYFLQADAGSYRYVAGGDLMTRAWRRLHIVAIASLIYRDRIGHFPDRLEDLALPADLTTDPFSNEPLFFFRPDPDRLTLYSVGHNRQNDGGIPQAHAGDSTDDIPLTLP